MIRKGVELKQCASSAIFFAEKFDHFLPKHANIGSRENMLDPKVRAKVKDLLRSWPQNQVCLHLPIHLPGLQEEDLPSLRTISRIAAELKAAGKPHRRPTKAEKMKATRGAFKPAKAALDRAAAAYRAGQTPPPGAKRATYAGIAEEFGVTIPTLVRRCRKLGARKKDVAAERARRDEAAGEL